METEKMESPGRVYGGVSKQTRMTQRRQRFVDAGIKLFGTAGYRAGTVRALCEEAGLTDRYFYESFRGTEDLLIASYRQLMDGLRERMLEAFAAAGPTWDDVATTGLRIYFEAVRDPLFARITLVEVLGVSDAVVQTYRANTEEFAYLILDTFRLLEPQLPVSKDDEEVLGVAMAGAVMISAMHWMQKGYSDPIERMIENCRKVLTGTARVVIENSKGSQS